MEPQKNEISLLTYVGIICVCLESSEGIPIEDRGPPDLTICGVCGPGYKHKTLLVCETEFCEPCIDGTFSYTNSSAIRCEDCTYIRCPLTQTKLSECTHTHDVVCDCKEGEEMDESGLCRKNAYAHKVWYNHKGVQCRKCSAGQYIHRDCSVNYSASICRTCQPGSYNPGLTDSKDCLPCATCGHGKVIIRNCSTTTNTICSSCPKDYLDIPSQAESGSYCREDIVTNPNIDTELRKNCSENYFFSGSTTNCRPCSKCTNIERPCNNTHDTICDDDDLHQKSQEALVIGLSLVAGIGILIVIIIVIVCRRHKNRKQEIVMNPPGKDDAPEKEPMVDESAV